MKKLLLFFVAAMIAGCYPDGPEYVDELDSVYTDYSPEFNFSQTYTYALPNAVINANGNPDNSPVFIDSDYSDAIISTLRSNLNGMGWTEVDKNDNPQVVLLAAGIDSDFLYYSFDWWGWYYPGYYPGWDWYYPWYSPGYYPGYISGFSVGTVVVQMTYAEGISNDEVPVVWISVINGLLEGTDAYISNRITNNINNAFMHPPFNN